MPAIFEWLCRALLGNRAIRTGHQGGGLKRGVRYKYNPEVGERDTGLDSDARSASGLVVLTRACQEPALCSGTKHEV